MGNHIPPGIPPLLAKNWQPVPNHPNSFRNKVTLQYTHKHIINVENSMQIQSFKHRMKQTNPYVCRVLFYHQYHQSIYHVFTDEIHLQFTMTKPQIWRTQKIRIVQSFMQLAHIYGFMKVNRQMIGADSNSHPKIWIHPDPVSAKPWSSGSSQSVMLTDILNIFRSVEERLNPKQRRMIGVSPLSSQKYQFTRFQQYIAAQTQILNLEAFQAKSRANKSSLILQNRKMNSVSTSQIVNNKKNVNMNNKSHAIDSNNAINKVSEMMPIRSPRYSNEQSQFIKNNRIQKIFNPTVCQTSRDEEPQDSNLKSKPKLSPYRQNQRTNFSLERPYTHYPTSTADQTKKQGDQTFKTVIGLSTNKRRQTQNFKLIQENLIKQQKSISKINQNNNKIINNSQVKKTNSISNTTSLINSTTNSTIPAEVKKNPLNKLLTQTQTPKSGFVAITSPNHQAYLNGNKTFQGLYMHQSKQQKATDASYQNNSSAYAKPNMDKSKPRIHQMSKKQYKYSMMPNFLMKSQIQTQKITNGNKPYPEKHPQTQRQPKNVFAAQFKKPQESLQKTNLNIHSTQSIHQDSQQYQFQPRSRKNTAAILKQQLHLILETPIQRPISQQYQNFKSTKVFYQAEQSRHFYTQSEQQSQKQQLDIIKEKVQKKKQKFAQLKNDARKILGEDF